MYRSYAWPKHNVNFKDKRVAVIGTGATVCVPMIFDLDYHNDYNRVSSISC